MSRCRETAGILFKKRCQHPATQNCDACNKPICRMHVRILGDKEVCISCARAAVEDHPSGRRSYAHLHDDPYFFWYYQSEVADPYGQSDFSLFDDGGAVFASDVEDQWEGT